jgi:hypothetical protein
MLAYDYYNAAILSVRETTNGVDKLEKLPGESRRQFNERRKIRLNNVMIRKGKK